jgi:hypothetical protein
MMASLIERTYPSIALDPRLRGRLSSLADGRVIVLGYYASRSCCSVVGDLAVDWRSPPPGPGFLELDPMDGVPVFADVRIIDVLLRGAPELRPGGIPRRGTPSLWLGIPECWIDFLEGPTVLTRRRST